MFAFSTRPRPAWPRPRSCSSPTSPPASTSPTSATWSTSCARHSGSRARPSGSRCARGAGNRQNRGRRPVRDALLYWARMTPKLFRAAEVCDIAQVQPFVLRSWEKEFPGIGVQKSLDSPRLYRQADVDQVLLIKRLVFSDGLTLSGARRKLEETAPRTPAVADQEVAEVLDALASDA